MCDDNLSVTHIFIKKIFSVPEEAPPSPHPTGVGENWIFHPLAAALVMAMKQEQ
jgi:hypothetical protein